MIIDQKNEKLPTLALMSLKKIQQLRWKYSEIMIALRPKIKNTYQKVKFSWNQCIHEKTKSIC